MGVPRLRLMGKRVDSVHRWPEGSVEARLEQDRDGALGKPGPGRAQQPHLEAAQSHVDLAAALEGTVEHLKQAVSVRHP